MATLYHLCVLLICSYEFPGYYNFKVSIPNSASSRQYRYVCVEEERFLSVGKGVEFAVNFCFKVPPPSNYVVSAMVLCKKMENIEKLGPVVKCKKHVEDGG